MATTDINYSTLSNEGRNPFRDDNLELDPTLDEDTPRNSGIMIHIVPETSKARWNHIEDLDSFFTRMYCYHQKHGFYVIALKEILLLVQFGFVVSLITYMTHCVRYPILFGDLIPIKVSLAEVLIPLGECQASFPTSTWVALIIAFLLLIFRFIKVIYHIVQFWDIKKFFNTALKIEDDDLDNITWHEVQKKVREVQSEQQMCIHKEQLSELDIYHRILRFKNYMVAMMNKNLLPVRFNLPIIGEVVALSRGLRYNLELILFRGPWSPFENNWHLREEYKRASNRLDLSRNLSRQILWVAAANFVLSPLVFLWQLTYISFSYATLLRKEPGALGTRGWSQYGRLYLRHFNELEHELDARLNRAYEPADKYMSSFSSPIMSVIAENLLFVCGGMLVVIVLLGIYEEHVFQVEHMLTIVSILTGIGVVSRVLIPDENLIWCPEQLLTAVLAHVHYLPVTWRGFAHTSKVRKEFGYFFQFKAVYLLNELLSPLITPFVLLFVFRPRSLDIVDFFRNFTVSVVGVGDVCSFAQMDVRKHGNPEWQLQSEETAIIAGEQPIERGEKKICETNQYTQGENGKTELSLVHFTLTNPEWKMPSVARNFMHGIKRHAIQDLTRAKVSSEIFNNATAMGQSLASFGSIGEEYSSIAQSVLHNHNIGGGGYNPLSFSAVQQTPRNVFYPQAPSSLAGGSQLGGNFGGYGHDFEHMLQQNLNDGSAMPMRSGILHNIQEGDAEDEDVRIASENMQMPSSSVGNDPFTTRSMDRSIRRKGVRKSEGSLEGPNDSLLYSLYGCNQPITADPSEITTADMCLSTLYLHELHHRQMQRRSSRMNRRNLWRSPTCEKPPPPPPQASSSSHSSTAITTANIAENTPLLGQKKS